MAFVLLLLSGGPALACSCVPQPPDVSVAVARAFESADAVVLAKATRVEARETANRRQPLEAELTTFETIRSWKGNVGPAFQTEIVTACCVCGLSFTAGETYLLYLHGGSDTDVFGTSICTRTTSIKDASADIEVLDRIGPARSPGRDGSPSKP